ncbi:MAG: peptide chain release factor N(5)-glutamine methyltransferase [Ruminococcus sp.]|nr:peptide chain release factor N(5)-glutamine methyltransferase [Ruminococcus sp.]
MNIKEAFSFTKSELKKAGVDNPAFDAIYLFEHIFSMSRTDIAVYGDKEIKVKDFEKLKDCIEQRKTHKPIQYIIGKWYFMGNTFKVSEGVLIPRDDTEVLVNACIDILKDKKNANIIDLCSGSGIIAVTIKKQFPHSIVSAVEKSDIAYDYLRKNCEDNQVTVNTIKSDLYACADDFEDDSIDLIVSNPPYIISDEINSLQKEVQFEPKLALDGGEDGYDFYRGIINFYAKKLTFGGHIAFEIGEGQFEFIKKLLENASFTDIKGYLDLGDTVRAVSAIYKP